MVVVEYLSDKGSFGEMFSDLGAGDVPVQFKTAAGLFSWLAPHYSADTSSYYFDDGTCRGYTARQRDGFSDLTFDVVRALGTIAIIFGFALLCCVLLMLCYSMNRWYIRGLAVAYLVECALVGLCFLVFRSGLCTNVGQDSSCAIDEGGLVGIAGAILFFVGFLITWMFASPIEDILIQVDGEIKSSFEERQDERRRAKEQRRRGQRGGDQSDNDDEDDQEEPSTAINRFSTPEGKSKQQTGSAYDYGGGVAAGDGTPETQFDMGENGDMEVYI